MTPMMKSSIPMKGSTMVRCTRITCERRSDHPRSCGTPSFLVIFPTIGPDTGVDDLRKAEPYDLGSSTLIACLSSLEMAHGMVRAHPR